MQEAYKTLVVDQHKPEEQLHARHILVDTKEAAEKIIADLKGGASFEELAKQSKDPSGQNGGDLGFFGKGQMVPPVRDRSLCARARAVHPGAGAERVRLARHQGRGEADERAAALRRGEGGASQLRAAAEIRAGDRRRCVTSIRSRSSTRRRCRRRRPRPLRPEAAPARRTAPPAEEPAAAPGRAARARAIVARSATSRWRVTSRRLRRPPFRSCRRLPASASRPRRPASATRGRTDLLLVRFDPAASVAGVFTQSRCASAPVEWDRRKLAGRKGEGARRQFRQRQRLHRRERPPRGRR